MVYPEYKYPVDRLYTGSSLGNRHAFARLDEKTNLKGLWNASDNQLYVGSWDVDIYLNGKQAVPKETRFSPESQMTIFDGPVQIEKLFFIPFSMGGNTQKHIDEMRAAIILMNMISTSSKTVEVSIRNLIYFPADRSEKFTKQPPLDQMEKRVAMIRRERYCEITTLGKAKEARVFGSSMEWTLCSTNDSSLMAEYNILLNGNETREISFVIAFSPEGIASATKGFQKSVSPREVLNESSEQYKLLLSRSFIYTPEPVINRGIQWAKVNTARVQHNYRIGEGFTNDPPQDIVVIRDLAWYIMGSDYITPEFSRGLLELGERYAFHPDGKLTEYIHATEDPPVLHDYELNINDDTPLYVYALWHHAVVSRDEFSFKHIYPLMKRACDYILTQMSDGLVWCHADGTNVWGICGWRNIIDNYNLTGAVTEINAECYYAFKLTAAVADRLGIHDGALRYSKAASVLKHAINEKLVSEKTGLYVLNVSNDETRHHDVTGDLIFPVLFDVADKNMCQRILEKLTDDDMWTPYGSRTVSRHEANYDPDFGYQLVGGLWHNLTAWASFCIRRDHPEKLVEGMINIYKFCEPECPVDWINVVPGEFPERIHGETFVSRGMAMSPWMPPTYVWLGVEGLLGVKPTEEGMEMNPALPGEWKWIGVKNLLVQGNSLDAFFFDGTLYSTREAKSLSPTIVGKRIDVQSDNDKIFSIGIKLEEEAIVFVACESDTEGSISAKIGGNRIEQLVSLKAGEAQLFHIPVSQSVSIG